MSHLMTKPTKWHVRPVKTRISLGNCPAWSESSLSAWRKLRSLATHWAHCKDWSDWVDAQADLSHRRVHMPFCWFCHKTAHMSSQDTYAIMWLNPVIAIHVTEEGTVKIFKKITDVIALKVKSSCRSQDFSFRFSTNNHLYFFKWKKFVSYGKCNFTL